jgi:hypothetical protein
MAVKIANLTQKDADFHIKWYYLQLKDERTEED